MVKHECWTKSRLNICTANFPYGEFFYMSKFPCGEIFYGEFAYGEVSSRRKFSYSEIPLRRYLNTSKISMANFPTMNFPTAEYPITGWVCRKAVLEGYLAWNKHLLNKRSPNSVIMRFKCNILLPYIVRVLLSYHIR